MSAWLKLAFRHDIVARGIRVSAVVGSILTAINYGDILLAGESFPAMYWKIPLTFFVPYCVATYASVESELSKRA